MGQIDFTNIIIDDFRKGRHNPFNRYVYILTHVHTDHLRGLSNTWNFGTIYCSCITRSLILNKFKHLKDVLKPIPLEQPTQISIAEGVTVTVTFFDANHCAGAIMILLEGYFGRYFYTGDFRFNEEIFREYTPLYPSQLMNKQFEKCSVRIDKLWLDNTFCNPKFNFPTQAQSLNYIEKFVNENKNLQILIGMDYYGKEQVLVHISKKFDLLIVIDEFRYENVITMDLDRQCFTTNRNEGTIEVVNKKNLKDAMKDQQNCVGLVMSGWNNEPHWRDNIFYAPYSLHSNYSEIVKFVKSIRPSLIDPIVELNPEDDSKNDVDLYSTSGNFKAFQNLRKSYTSPLTQQFRRNMEDPQFLESLKKKFEIDRPTVEINKKQLGLATTYVPNRGKGYKLNIERDEEEISSLKKKILEKRNMRKLKEIVINDDDSDKAEEIVISQNDDDQIQIVDKADFLEHRFDKGEVKKLMQKSRQIRDFQAVDFKSFQTIKSLTTENEVIMNFYQQWKEAMNQGD